jgi:hypothetical protein
MPACGHDGSLKTGNVYTPTKKASKKRNQEPSKGAQVLYEAGAKRTAAQLKNLL